MFAPVTLLLAIIIVVMAKSSNIYFPKILETWNLKFKYVLDFVYNAQVPILYLLDIGVEW